MIRTPYFNGIQLPMKSLYNRFVNVGVHTGLEHHEVSRIRIINLLQSAVLTVFLLYLLIGIYIQSVFVISVCSFFIAASIVGMMLQARYHYYSSRTLFLVSASILIFFVTNSVVTPQYFIVFYFIIFAAYVTYYDLERDVPKAAWNLAFTLFTGLCATLLPQHLFFVFELTPHQQMLFKYLNYPVAFVITLLYLLCTVWHINRSARHLINSTKEAERQQSLMREEKMKAESLASAQARFVSNMSHELRTPLNGIIGSVQLLLQEPRLPEQQHYFDVLKFSSEHMLNLINDVLDFSKLEAGKMELSNDVFHMGRLVEKIKTVFEDQFQRKEVAFHVHCTEGVERYFKGDETRLNQVLHNLISNAMKFTAHGSVQLLVQLLEADSHQATLRFAVKDTGIGISTQQQARIFDAFRQGEGSNTSRRFGGTGLGLTISKTIVGMMGGDLQVQSREGTGSTFHFSLILPVVDAGKVFVNEDKVRQLNSLSGMRVLVAEDSAVNMVITRKFLQRWDVNITEAVNGKIALEQFLSGNPFNLLLIDLDMPVMDGYATIEQVRKKDAHIPAIAFTAAVFPNMKQQLQERGFTDFLQKPFKPEDLHRKLLLYGCKPGKKVA